MTKILLLHRKIPDFGVIGYPNRMFADMSHADMPTDWRVLYIMERGGQVRGMSSTMSSMQVWMADTSLLWATSMLILGLDIDIAPDAYARSRRKSRQTDFS
jgi:hypothetical protein